MPLPLDATEALIADLNQRMEKLRVAHYQGRDRAGLATAVVDGDGTVVSVKLAPTMARHTPQEVGEAIREALGQAQLGLARAYEDLARQAETWEQEQS